jgi:hypothetical protein
MKPCALFDRQATEQMWRNATARTLVTERDRARIDAEIAAKSTPEAAAAVRAANALLARLGR